MSNPEKKKVDSWSPPENYYQDRANQEVDPKMHRFGVWATSLILSARHGLIEVYAPEETLNHTGGAILSPVHRSEIDTVLVPEAAERVGLHHAQPMAKGGLFSNRLAAFFLHRLGAFGVRRGDADLAGINMASEAILERGGNLTIYDEGTRIHKDTSKVSKLSRSSGIIAAKTGKPLIPVGIGGLSKEKDGKKVIRQDKIAPFGFGPPVVVVFGSPIYAIPDYEKFKTSKRAEFMAGKQATETLAVSLQQCLDRAYEIRGSSLEA